MSIEHGGSGVDIRACECLTLFVSPNGGWLSSLWAVRPIVGCGGQSVFVGGCGGHFLLLVAFCGLWVIICGGCMWSLIGIVIAWVHSWVVAILVLLLLGSWGRLPWYGDGFVIGRCVVVAVGSIVGMVVVG